MLSKNILDYVIKYEIDNLGRNYNSHDLIVGRPSLSNLILSVDSSKTSFTDAQSRDRYCMNEGYYHPLHYDKFLDNVTSSIYKPVDSITVKEAIKTLIELKQSLGNTLAGVLILVEGKIVNIGHPLVAMGLVSGYTLNLRCKIVVYHYENREHVSEWYQDEAANLEAIGSNINNLLLMYASANRDRQIKRLSAESSDSGQIDIQFQVSMSPDEDPNFLYYLVPNQLLTKGIVAPYYGTSLVRQELCTSYVTGLHLTPMLSANISYVSSLSDWTSVCTGSVPKATVAGLKTLNHSNLSSPYNRDILFPGALVYADKCIEKSIEIYKLSGLLND